MTRTALDKAEKLSTELFDAVERANLIIPGKSESQLSLEVCTLAAEQFGIESHWHKKIVRAGGNTMCIYPDNPPDIIIAEDDLVILDFGPIVEGYEADLGRTYVMGSDPAKLKLKKDVEEAWYEIRTWYNKQFVLRSSDLFRHVVEKAADYGYRFGGEIAGHIVGKYPHEQPLDPKSLDLDIHPDNHNDMFLLDANGDKRHWILELLFIDEEKQLGGYFEQLL